MREFVYKTVIRMKFIKKWRIYEKANRKEAEDIDIYPIKHLIFLRIYTIFGYYFSARKSTNC
ncbi:hypothetical protein EMIT079MI2_90096 [Bacillus sp. IT-79MI2]